MHRRQANAVVACRAAKCGSGFGKRDRLRPRLAPRTISARHLLLINYSTRGFYLLISNVLTCLFVYNLFFVAP